MKVLITGAAGFIGSHLTAHLSANTGHELVAVDKAGPDVHPFSDIQRFDLEDLPELEKLLRTEHPEAVVHLAAMNDPRKSIEDPLAFYAANVSNTLSLLRLCLQQGVGKFVFASSAAVYGIQEHGAIEEDRPLHPTNPYGRSKVICEEILEDTTRSWKGFECVILRLFFVVGSNGRLELGGQPHANENVIRIAAQAALGKRDRMVLYGDSFDTPDGTCVRDFIHIDDISQVMLKSLDYLQRGNASRVFNCGSGLGYSIKEMVATMKKVSGVDFPVEMLQPRPNEYPSLVADITRAREFLDWRSKHHSLESLCRMSLEMEQMLPLATSAP